MKKQWYVAGCGGVQDTYEKAEEKAKKYASQYKTDAIIYEAVAMIKYPIPEFEVVKITA